MNQNGRLLISGSSRYGICSWRSMVSRAGWCSVYPRASDRSSLTRFNDVCLSSSDMSSWPAVDISACQLPSMLYRNTAPAPYGSPSCRLSCRPRLLCSLNFRRSVSLVSLFTQPACRDSDPLSMDRRDHPLGISHDTSHCCWRAGPSGPCAGR